MAPDIHFFWETGSTNTYFALHLIRPVAERHRARVIWHPLNLGYVFRHHNYVLMEEPPAKIANRKRDLHRWADRYSLPFRFPSEFPIKTSRTLRASLALRDLDRKAGHETGAWDSLEVRFIHALFRAYWEEDNSAIQTWEGMAPLAEDIGVDPAELEARSESDAIRAALAAETEAALEAGVFGCPSFLIDGELYWGKDRMAFIEDALKA